MRRAAGLPGARAQSRRVNTEKKDYDVHCCDEEITPYEHPNIAKLPVIK